MEESAQPTQTAPPVHFLTRKIFLLLILLAIAIPFISFVLSQKGTFQKSNLKFELVESSPQDQDSDFSVVSQPTFVFSKKIGIPEKDLDEYVSINPKPKGNWHIEKNGKVLYFSKDVKQEDSLPQTFDFNKIYTVRIKNKLSSVDSKNLEKDIELSFRTEKNSKYPRIEPDKKLVNFFPDQEENVEFQLEEGKIPLVNIKAHIKVRTATEEQLLTYFQSKKGKTPLYNFSETPQNKIVDEYDLGPIPNSSPARTITLGLRTNKPGLYFVTVENETIGREDFFVSISSHINQVFGDINNSYIWTTDYKSGKSLSGVSARLFSVENEGSQKVIASGKTNDKGLFISKKLDDVDFIITKTGNDSAITKLEYYKTQLSDYPKVFSYNDRPIYRPGDIVHYKAILRENKNGGYVIPKDKKVYALLNKDFLEGEKKDYKELTIDENGTVSYDFTLPLNIDTSYPSISLLIKKDDQYTNINTLSLSVSSYRKPDMDIDAQTSNEYISKDTANATLFAKTLYGEPLTDTAFSYKVIASDFQEVKETSLEELPNNYYYGSGKELAKGKGAFNKKGKAEITFSTDLSQFEKSQLSTIEITPNIGASPSIGKTQTLIHRGEFALFFENVQSQTATLSGNVLALDHKSPRTPYPLEKIDLSLYKIDNYNSNILVDKKQLSQSSPDFFFSFPNLSSGTYELVAKALDKRENLVTNRQQFYVTAINANDNAQKKYSLKIDTKKELFEPGESPLIDVKANFKVENALVVIYTGKQISSVEEFKPEKENWSFRLNIPKDQSKTLGIDILSVFDGYVVQEHKDVEINYESKKISTTLTFNKTNLKPGDTVTAEITTKDFFGKPISADNSLAIFDSALLQIRNSSLAVFTSFYYNDYPSLWVFNSTTGIYGGFRGGGGGGGGGEENQRENFVDTAYWNPHIKTGADGKATITFKIPDNLTTFRAEVVSNTNDSKFGQASSEIISKKDVAIIPTIPNFFYRDDKTVISALVQNSSEKDIKTAVAVSIIETGYSKTISLTVGKGDYEILKIPTQVSSKKDFITISITVKDNSGTVLDSLILKKPVLPRGRIETTLESFNGSNSIDFIPKYSGLDFNTLKLTIIPHAASRLFENAYLSGEPNVRNTQALYVWAYILSKTKSGLIPPNSYKYAKMKNDFRVAFNYLLTEKMPQGSDVFWYPKYASSDESRLTINLWARQAIVQAKEMGMADEITNLTKIIQSSKTYILDIVKKKTQPPSKNIPKNLNPLSGTGFTLGPPIYINPEEQTPLFDTQKFLLTWFGFGFYSTNNKALNEAVSALKDNDKTALEKLKNERYLSSDDRFIFDGDTIYSRALPALALIEKGSKEDSKKAIKGLSIAGGIYSDDPFILLAGVKDVLKRGIDLENTGIKVSLDGETIDEIKDKDKNFNDISHSFTSKTKEGLKVRIETLGNFPFYTIAVKTQLNDKNKEQEGLLDRLIEKISPSEKTKGKVVDAKLSRVYKNIGNGQTLSAIGEGQSGVVELSFLYPFTSKFIPNYSSLYEINITEAISPSFMYLNQATGNSTQDTSTLDKLYPKLSSEKPIPYSLPESYSDQAVFFKSSGTGYLNPIFTYVVFGISPGSYYQPKTSAVLPRFGLIIEEK